MGNRKITIYIALGFIVSSLILALYFFVRKPDKISHRPEAKEKQVIVFKDVTYSGEKKGVVDWEIKAKVARKYIDKPLIELENLSGQYKPQEGTLVTFAGTKGAMDTEKESGSVENVSVLYKGEYTLTSSYMNFDFKNGTTFTKAPVHITGNKLTMQGIGLTANTKQETVRLETDVSGIVTTEKARYKFQTDVLTYHFKDNLYVLEGKVILRGEDLNLLADRLLIFTAGKDLDRIEAYGNVRVLSKGTVAKSEKAVYHFKQGKIVFTNSPRVTKDNVEMEGESVVYTTGEGKISVNKPRVRVTN
ncbi:MAG TPA: LPS export ABC transporter periplasmic protein LptC [Syntrophorhabdaceae bacterium]|nr:LPS export ABC transporter periplasmic protein LptC [Syntrophorhabdaceae bacterium]